MSIDNVPKEPYSKSDVNRYGDVSTVKPGWVQVPRIKVRNAPEKFTIVVGWKRSSWGNSPIKAAVVPKAWWDEKCRRAERREARPRRCRGPLAPDVKVARRLRVPVARLRRAIARHGEAVVARLERRRSLQAKRQREAYRRQHLDHWVAVVKRANLDVRFRFDPEEAAGIIIRKLEAREGVARRYLSPGRGGIATDDKFAFIVLGAAHRHTHTDYDDLLREGVSRWRARLLARPRPPTAPGAERPE